MGGDLGGTWWSAGKRPQGTGNVDLRPSHSLSDCAAPPWAPRPRESGSATARQTRPRPPARA
eukprot:4698386-Alexandrium_andersonii.AAC.1